MNTAIALAHQNISPSYYYTVYISEWIVNNRHIGIYDVELYLSARPTNFSYNFDKRRRVYTLVVKSRKYVDLTKVTRYMIWKFPHHQLNTTEYLITSTECYFPMINRGLHWIISIIDVELDYHIGRQICMRAENKQHLRKYMQSIRNSYHGPQYYRDGMFN